MNTWIAFLRGINVGGNNILPMQDLRHLLERQGFERARTYIQSGNCVFQTKRADRREIEHLISTSIETTFGFRPNVLALRQTELLAAIAANPYPEGADEPKSVHLFFLAEPANPSDLPLLEDLKAATERYHLTERVLYLHAPDGIGRSKLAAKVERTLGVSMTARNLRTAVKVSELVP
ncbi:MAG: DUF1697 domain-containing protein [Pseudomonadota bacterium]